MCVTEKAVRARWGNGLASLQQWLCYLQEPGFESHLRPVEFFSCNKVSPLNSQTPKAKTCAMCPNYLARDYQGLHVKQTNKKLEWADYSCVGSIGWMSLLALSTTGSAWSVVDFSVTIKAFRACSWLLNAIGTKRSVASFSVNWLSSQKTLSPREYSLCLSP